MCQASLFILPGSLSKATKPFCGIVLYLKKNQLLNINTPVYISTKRRGEKEKNKRKERIRKQYVAERII